ncbi:uncharacterized protein si:ch211-13c6.2 isoform X2 [Labrus mixtus]|nr:uncharacterized protein si:ch211-13c6.2 isoform X2 [Labrus mixtus]
MVPIFEDIIHYLDYMKLDEPIIGLNYLEEFPSNDILAGPRYTCSLCHQTANLQETVRHVIGRKHRQKYVEMKRPDLVTWDKQTITNQGGKIFRARAEIIERQDGRGTPSQMVKKRIGGQLNISRAPLKQNQNRGRTIPQSSTQRDMPSHLPRLMDHPDEYSHQGRVPPGHINTPPCHLEDPPYMMDRDRPMYRQKDRSHDRLEGELLRADYRESDAPRGEFIDPDYRREYERERAEDPQKRAPVEPLGGPRYDSREEMLHDQALLGDFHSDEAPPYRRPYQERDLLKEFYSEEVRRRQVQPSQPGYLEGENHRWSLDRDSVRHDVRVGRPDPSDAEAKRWNFPKQVEGKSLHDHLFNMIRDNLGEMRKPHQVEELVSAGPSRMGPSQPQRQVEVSRTMSDIPEPFRRFLKGPSNEEQQNSKRKRKSRFSDATAEEVETTKELFSDEYGPPNPKFSGHLRPLSSQLRPEIHGTQHPDLYIQSQSIHHSDFHQPEGSDSGGVFDMLKNIDIENAEEANFLKSKLCDLLKEFKSKKSEKAAGQNSQGRAVASQDFDSFNPNPELASRHQYEPASRQDSDLRRPEELYFQENRSRSRERRELLPDDRLQEYHHPVHGEPRKSIRSQYDEDFGWQEKFRIQHASNPDEPACYPERFQEPRHSRDYRPPAAEILNSHSSAPSRHFDRGPRMDRGPRYQNNMDKITSTLLELVARK